MREISSLLNAEVISIKEGKRLGSITQVIVDLAQGKLLGLILGKGAAEKGVAARDIKTMGPDVVMVEVSTVAKRLSELPDLLAARRDPTRMPQQVVTDAGQRLGRLGRIFIDSVKLTVGHFEISGGAWRDLTEGVLALPVVKGIIHGPDTIIIPAAGLAQAMESPSLVSSMEKAAESMRVGGKQLGKILESNAEALRKTLDQPITTSGLGPVKPAPKSAAKAAKPAAPAAPKPAAKAAPKSAATKAAKSAAAPAKAKPRASAAKKSGAAKKPK